MATQVWEEVDAATIQHCWCKASILPTSLSTPDVTNLTSLIPIDLLPNEMTTLSPSFANTQEVLFLAEEIVADGLVELEKRGALQAKNQMSIEELLNPLVKTFMMEDVTDEDIYTAVEYGAVHM